MKKAIFLLSFLLLLYGKSISQTRDSSITEQDYYNFYNSISEPDSLKTYKLTDKPNNYSLDTIAWHANYFFDKIFDKKDSDFFTTQYKQITQFKWEAGKIKRAKIIEVKELDTLLLPKIGFFDWGRFQKKYGSGGFWAFSIPYFSKDKNTCMVIMDNYCGGLCGEGRAFYYKRNGSRWQLVYVLDLWIS